MVPQMSFDNEFYRGPGLKELVEAHELAVRAVLERCARRDARREFWRNVAAVGWIVAILSVATYLTT
jgi:hypothetical protein